MPVLSTRQELLAALDGSAFAADPLRDLAHRGFTLVPALHEQLLRELAGRPLASPPAGFSPDRIAGSFTFRPAAPILPAAPPPGTYDVVAGLRFSVSNLVIDALFQSGTIPHRLEFDQIRQSSRKRSSSFFTCLSLAATSPACMSRRHPR